TTSTCSGSASAATRRSPPPANWPAATASPAWPPPRPTWSTAASPTTWRSTPPTPSPWPAPAPSPPACSPHSRWSRPTPGRSPRDVPPRTPGRSRPDRVRPQEVQHGRRGLGAELLEVGVPGAVDQPHLGAGNAAGQPVGVLRRAEAVGGAVQDEGR